RTTDYVFDWDNMLTFEGNTAPYMQYAYTRIRSIFARAGINADSLNAEIQLSEDKERALAVKLLQFEEALNGVAKDGMPHILCQYLYELAGTFSSFYEACPILSAEENVKNSRLALAALTAKTLKQGLDLLGIKTVEKM
ncbi:MAG: DALR anticodon-binding domain-containing protein, partial [Mannheimia varigena]|nr:DALR anticodon-binding domain-containing protein [Mannheimia varigena]